MRTLVAPVVPTTLADLRFWAVVGASTAVVLLLVSVWRRSAATPAAVAGGFSTPQGWRARHRATAAPSGHRLGVTGRAAARQRKAASAQRARRQAERASRPAAPLSGGATVHTGNLDVLFDLSRRKEPAIAVRWPDVVFDVADPTKPSIAVRLSRPAVTVAEPPARAESAVSEPSVVEPVVAASSPPAAPAADTAPEPPPYETCQIRWWRGYLKSEFLASRARDVEDSRAAHDGELAVASSPPFKWRRSVAPERTADAVDAYNALVTRLIADGWDYEGTEGEWYAARFRRRLPIPGDPSGRRIPSGPAGRYHGGARSR